MKCGDTFNSYFNGVVKKKIPINENLLENVINVYGPIVAVTKKYKRYSVILKNKENTKPVLF